MDKQSWAFLCDPLLAVAFAITALAYQSPKMTTGHWYSHWWWYVLAAPVIGVAITTVFCLMDHPRYKNIEPTALYSPTKMLHDYVTYPVMFSGAIATMMPLLWQRSWHTWVVLGIVLVWVLAGVADMFRDLDPKVQHIAWNPVKYDFPSA